MSWRAVFGAIVIVVMAACTGGSHRAAAPATSEPVSTSSSRSSTVEPQAPLSARIQLPATTMKTGTTMQADVVLTNNTGAPVETSACHGGLFLVGLRSDQVESVASFPSCWERMTISTGVSTYPVSLVATYSSCTHDETSTAPHCVPTGMPSLPPGQYQARLYQDHDVVPSPPSIAIEVTP
jgi:hypothetical protein